MTALLQVNATPPIQPKPKNTTTAWTKWLSRELEKALAQEFPGELK